MLSHWNIDFNQQIVSLDYLLFLFWAMMSYTGHIAFISTFTEYAETAAAEPRPYIDFYGNISFASAFVAVIIALLIDFHSRNITDQDKGQI